MAHLHYVTVTPNEDLFSAFMRWEASRPADALNVFAYRHEQMKRLESKVPARHRPRRVARTPVRQAHDVRRQSAKAGAV